MTQEKVALQGMETQDEKIYAATEEKRKYGGNSAKEIIRSIEWPSPVQAVKSSLYAFVATGVIGCVLHLYSYGINEVIHMILQ